MPDLFPLIHLWRLWSAPAVSGAGRGLAFQDVGVDQFLSDDDCCLVRINKKDPQAHTEIMDIFDGLLDRRLEALIEETLKNESSSIIFSEE